jgi:hypothetical protein
VNDLVWLLTALLAVLLIPASAASCQRLIRDHDQAGEQL